jgi:hypothetical protein
MALPDQFVQRFREPFHESICRVCTKTVGRAKVESQLARDEEDHVCDPYMIAMIKKNGVAPEILIKLLYEISN